MVDEDYVDRLDLFAALAMHAILQQSFSKLFKETAASAYAMADAMMKERDERSKKD